MSSPKDRGWNLYTRNDGQHVLSFRVGPGKWKETRIPREHNTPRRAERYAVAWLAEYQKNLGERPVLPVEPPPDRGPTIRELSEKWLDLVDASTEIRKATKNQHKGCMNAHVLAYPEIADVPIPELGSGALREWLRKLKTNGKITTKWESDETGKKVRKQVRGGPLAAFTVRNVVNSLTTFFSDAKAEQWISLAYNPMKDEHVRKLVPEGATQAGKNVVVHFTRAQVEAYVTAKSIPEWRRVRLLLEVTSGLNEGEVSGLRWADVYLDDEIAHIDVNKSLQLAGEDGHASMGPTKNENRIRKVPLHPVTTTVLRAWKKSGWVHRVGRQASPQDHVFVNEEGLACRPAFAEMLRADLRSIGLPDKYAGKHLFNAQAARRTFSTWLGEADVDLAVRKRLMGQGQSDVNERHYTMRTLAKLQAAVQTIKLDLSTGQVIALPLRKVAGGEDMTTSTDSQTATDTALLTAVRGMPAATGSRKRAQSAPPTRIERVTFGLGNRCSIL